MSTPLLASSTEIVNTHDRRRARQRSERHAAGRGGQDGQARDSRLLLSHQARTGRPLPRLSGRNRRDAEAADRLQHARRPTAWSCARSGERVEAARAMILELFWSIIRWIVRSATRAASAICRITRWPTRAATSDVADPKLSQAQSGRSRADDRARRRALRRLPALRSLRRHHRRRTPAGRQRSRRARHHRDGDGTSLPPQLYRQRDRALPGRRADVEDVSLQVATVGSAIARRRAARSAPSAASSSPTCVTATLLRTMLVGGRSRSPTAGSAIAGAITSASINRPIGLRSRSSVRTGRSCRSAGTMRSFCGPRRFATRIDARGAASVGAIGGGRLTNEEAYVLQHVFRTFGVNNLDWRAGRQRQATPGANGRRRWPRSKARKAIVIVGDRPKSAHRCCGCACEKPRAQRSDDRRGRDARRGACRVAGDAARVALIWDGIDSALARAYAQAFSGVTELSTYVASEQGNARGAEAMGMLPGIGPGYACREPRARRATRCSKRARNGQLAVLSIFGANPVRNATG